MTHQRANGLIPLPSPTEGEGVIARGNSFPRYAYKVRHRRTPQPITTGPFDCVPQKTRNSAQGVFMMVYDMMIMMIFISLNYSSCSPSL